MGINVVSGFSAISGLTVGTPGTGQADAATGDFAALLSLQALFASGTESSLADTTGLLAPQQGRDGELRDDTAPDALAEEDAAILASMLGLPPTIPQQKPNVGEFTQVKAGTSDTGTELGSALTDSLTSNGSALGKSSDRLAPSTEKTAGLAEQLLGTTEANPDKKPANIAVESAEQSLPASFGATLAAATTRQADHTAQTTHLPATVGSASWPAQFGEKIVWMAKNEQQSAQINLNPAQLGPVQITLNLNGDQATAIFASPHAEVRQAIESAMPQLRDMLSAAGITLGDTNVGANLAQQNPNPQFQAANGQRATPENAILPANDNAANVVASPLLQAGRGLVDLFA